MSADEVPDIPIVTKMNNLIIIVIIEVVLDSQKYLGHLPIGTK